MALVLVDVINDFFHPDGPNYHPAYEPILDNIKRLLAIARENRVTVVHAAEGHHPKGHPDFEWRKLPEHDIVGTFAARLAEGVETLEGEYVVRKRRFSAFFATDLDLLLREAGVKRLLVVGVKTHVCVRATVQDAFGYGYDVAVVKGAIGSNYTHLHEASLEDIERYMGQSLTMKEAVEVLRSQREGE
jgi:nicotinamidase-related amidase